MINNQLVVPEQWVICDASGCPRYSVDLTPSGWTNKQPGPPLTYGVITHVIDPITVLMKPPGLLDDAEIASLGWPPALGAVLDLLRK